MRPETESSDWAISTKRVRRAVCWKRTGSKHCVPRDALRKLADIPTRGGELDIEVAPLPLMPIRAELRVRALEIDRIENTKLQLYVRIN